MMIRILFCLILLLTISPLNGCATPGSDEVNAASSGDTDVDVATESRRPMPRDPDAYGPGPGTPIDEAEIAEAESTPAADPEEFESVQDDNEVVPETGRPTWWFSEHRRSEDGRVTICAEVLGATMLDVRRGVLDEARRQMREHLGLADDAPIPGEAIDRVWTTPLPTARSGDVRYAGYAMLSAGGEG